MTLAVPASSVLSLALQLLCQLSKWLLFLDLSITADGQLFTHKQRIWHGSTFKWICPCNRHFQWISPSLWLGWVPVNRFNHTSLMTVVRYSNWPSFFGTQSLCNRSFWWRFCVVLCNLLLFLSLCPLQNIVTFKNYVHTFVSSILIGHWFL